MVPESRDIAVFVADQLSGGEKRLLPKEGPERERVIEMLDLHGTLPIEPLTQVPTYKYVLFHVFNYLNYPQILNIKITQAISQPEYQTTTKIAPFPPHFKAHMMVINRVAAFFLPSSTRKRIEALERLKGERPELAEVIEARIPDLQRRLEFFEEPVKFKEESLVTLGAALDVLEKGLSEEEGGGPFICGEDYTLADVCFTCTIARYGRTLISEEN